MAHTPSKMEMLGTLERIRYQPRVSEEAVSVSKMSLPESLLELVGLNHEQEYLQCRAIAQHLLGEIPEPDDINFDGI